jgi:hypothetical protein
MNALEAAALIGALIIPFHVLLQRQLALLREHVRSTGIVIEDERVLEARGEVIGRWQGRDIHAFVVYMGIKYLFGRIEQAKYRRRVRERELWLEPGLVYVTD